jgi:hypothetical protein
MTRYLFSITLIPEVWDKIHGRISTAVRCENTPNESITYEFLPQAVKKISDVS